MRGISSFSTLNYVLGRLPKSDIRTTCLQPWETPAKFLRTWSLNHVVRSPVGVVTACAQSLQIYKAKGYSLQSDGNKSSGLLLHQRNCSTNISTGKNDEFAAPPHCPPDAPIKNMHKNKVDHHLRLLKDPDQPENAKCLKIAVIGAPNSGKSTLTNALLGWRISSVSSKVHTTRSRINAILTEEDTQLIFLDTPGLIHPSKRKKHKLDHSLIRDPHSSLYQADIVAVVVDVSVPWVTGGLDREVLKVLALHEEKPSILVLNKVDLLKSKQKLLNLTRLLTEGVVEGQRDSFLVKNIGHSRKKIKDLLDKDTTVKLVEKHTKKSETEGLELRYDDSISDQTHDALDSSFSDLDLASKLRTEISQAILGNTSRTIFDQESDLDQDLSFGVGKTSLETSSEQKSGSRHDLWCAGGVFQGDKIVSAMTEQKKRSSVYQVSASEASDWEDYSRVLNKVEDAVEHRQGWNKFQQVFMVSSTENDGIEDLRDYLCDLAPPSDWLYHSSVLTDQDPVEIVRHCVWEKLLDNLPHDIPYNLDLELELMMEEGSMLRIVMNVVCPTERHMKFTMGKKGGTIKKIAEEAKQALMNTFRCDLSLMLVCQLQK